MASDITKLNAATSQLARAIQLYFEDGDPVPVHTLASAASELIDRLCELKGLTTIRNGLLARIVPHRRKEVADAMNAPANYFKHASSRKLEKPLSDFSDDRNLIPIINATDGLRQLGVDLPEARIFSAWLFIVDPDLALTPPPKEFVALVFGDITNQPRQAQKRVGRDALHWQLTGKLPDSKPASTT